MTAASTTSIALGLLYLVAFLSFSFAPAATRRALLAFPRNRIAGALLATAALGWFCWLLHVLNWGGLERLRPLLYTVGPIFLLLVIIYMDELLAVRGLGGLMLLVGVPILEAVRWADTRWRWLIAVLVYLMVIKAMILVLTPYRFRQWVEFLYRTPARMRVAQLSALLLAVVLVTLGFTVFSAA